MTDPLITRAESNPQDISPKPVLAIISNSQTPYRVHLHRRIAAELSGVTLWSLYTHEFSNVRWPFEAPAEIKPVLFGKGESCMNQDKPTHGLAEWRRGGKIIRWLKKHNARAVVMMGYNDPGRLRIMWWCHRAHVPCFLFGDSNIHGDRANGKKAKLKKLIVGQIVAWCSGILTCGTLGKAYFAKYGADERRMFFFPYEPDYYLIKNISAAEIENARKKFGLVKGRRRLVYSGRLVDVKRVDLLVDAFVNISADRPAWDLVVIGDGPLRVELETKLPESLKSRVRWTGFLDDQSTVSAIYRASDVLVLPSDYEPWALVINESAAAGMAIIASNVVGAAAELVRDGVNGRVFPPGDQAALQSCLLDVTSDDRIDSMKSASAEVLAGWRARGDPVNGLADALGSVGVI